MTELKDAWKYIKKNINPQRKKAGIPPISYTEAKNMVRQTNLLSSHK